MNQKMTAACINTLADFCGMRDLPALTRQALKEKYNLEKADVMVLFGGSIAAGMDVLAKAMQEDLARFYVIAGGAGHTTQTLRDQIRLLYPAIETDNLSEAEIFNRCLDLEYGLQADYLETKSTNCGNNITNLLDLIRKNNLPFSSVILCQDASMQRRMDAGMRKYAPADLQIISYAAYCTQAVSENGTLKFSSRPKGMWTMDRYVSLLMGEIPRLTDNAEGYGPLGKNFIAHVNIPDGVREAFEQLKEEYGSETRAANPEFASAQHGQNPEQTADPVSGEKEQSC